MKFRFLIGIIFLVLSVSTFAQSTTPNLGITKPQTGQAQPQVTIATGFDAFDAAVAGRLSKSVAGSADVTLSTTEARNAIYEFTGALTGNVNVIVPNKNRKFIVYNNTSGAFTLTIKTAAGTGIAVTQGTRVWLYCDSTNVVSVATTSGATAALDNLASVNINTSLLAQSGVDLGSTAKPFRDFYLYGGGTFGTNYFKFTGTPTSTRTLTIPDRTATLATTSGTLTSGNCAKFDASGNIVDHGSACGGGGSVDWKDSVRAATTVAGTLTTDFENGDIVDGVTLATGDRILIKNQSTGSENGPYTVNASGAPTRATDADTSAEVTGGLAIFVNEGTANGNTNWFLTTNDPITLGTTALTFAQISGGGGTPGGSSTQVQYNNSGAFGGISRLTSDGTNMTAGSGNLRATNPRITTGLLDANGNTMAGFSPSAGTVVNNLTFGNAQASGVVTVGTTGTDTDVELDLNPKGAGGVTINHTSTTSRAALRIRNGTENWAQYNGGGKVSSGVDTNHPWEFYTNGVFGGGFTIRTDKTFLIVTVAFSGLGTTGNFAICSDCTVTSGSDNTCAGSGTGALAVRLNSVWRCFNLQN